eukprot:g12872.t1
MQSANGPCPFLAICNVLLLRDSQLMRLLELEPPITRLKQASSPGSSAPASPTDENLHTNLHKNENSPDNEQQADASSMIWDGVFRILPKLCRGLDVNVHFEDVDCFEFTEELSVFDLFDIDLYHGWICPKSDPCYDAVVTRGKSYNQVVEKVFTLQDKIEAMQKKLAAGSCASSGTSGGGHVNREGHVGQEQVDHDAQEQDTEQENLVDSTEASLSEECLQLQRWLDKTAAQFTYAGLIRLHDKVVKDTLSVLLRNCHFSVIYMVEGQLYSLNTDEAFLLDQQNVWERITEVDGDTLYVDHCFRSRGEREAQRREEADRQLAMRLAEQEEAEAEAEAEQERRAAVEKRGGVGSRSNPNYPYPGPRGVLGFFFFLFHSLGPGCSIGNGMPLRSVGVSSPRGAAGHQTAHYGPPWKVAAEVVPSEAVAVGRVSDNVSSGASEEETRETSRVLSATKKMKSADVTTAPTPPRRFTASQGNNKKSGLQLRDRWDRASEDGIRLVMIFVATVDAADGALLASSFKAMEQDFGYSPSSLGLLQMCQSLGFALALPVFWGSFLPQRGARDLLLAAAGAWALCTGCMPFCSGLRPQLALRFVNGLAMAGCTPLAQAILAEQTDEADRGKAFGMLGATMSVARICISYLVIRAGTTGTGAAATGSSADAVDAPHLLASSGDPLQTTGSALLWWHYYVLVSVATLGLCVPLIATYVPPDYGKELPPEGRSTSTSSTKISFVRRTWQTVRKITAIPSFLVLIAQGIAGGTPWLAMGFLNMYWETLGFDTAAAASIVAITHTGGIFGSLLGGWLGDLGARLVPHNYGRIAVAQTSVFLGIPLWYLLLDHSFLVRPVGGSTSSDGGLHASSFSYYAAIVIGFLFFLSATWCSVAANKPICAELVSQPHERAQIVAIWMLIEITFGAFLGTPVVGLVSEWYGYNIIVAGASRGAGAGGAGDDHAVDTKTSASKDAAAAARARGHDGDLQTATNIASLSTALTGLGVWCWGICLITWCFMYKTFPRDKRKCEEEARRRESGTEHGEDEALQHFARGLEDVEAGGSGSAGGTGPLIDKLAAQMQTLRFCGHVTVCGSTKNLEEIEVVGRVRDVVARLTGSGGALRAEEPVSVSTSTSGGDHEVVEVLEVEDHDHMGGTALQLTGPVSLPIAFTDVRSMQNTWQQDLFLAARPTVALNELAIALQSALLSGGPALIASQKGEVGHRLLWAAPCEVPHYSLLYAEGGHDEEGENGAAKQKYERLREQVRETLGLVNSSGEYRCEGAALAVVQIGGPGIARGWEGIPSWRIVEKIPLKTDDDEEMK